MWRYRRLGIAIFTALAATLACSQAGAATPPQTLRGAQQQNGIANDPEPASLSIDTTFTASTAQGTVRTVQATASEAWSSFRGEVTCARQSGPRIVIGAFGHAYRETIVYDEQKNERVRISDELPGTYMQVIAFEYGNFEDPYGNKTFHPHSWNTIGEGGGGAPSAAPPRCKDWSTLRGNWVGEIGEIGLSPTITAPREGTSLPSGQVTLKGRGEPESALKIFEPAHPASATSVLVSSKGTWSLLRSGLAKGRHEFEVQPQRETGVTEPVRVAFSVK